MTENFPQVGDGSRYVINQCLGSGGMGTVYRAKDNELKRDVAIKVLHDHYAKNPEARARLDREVSVLAGLRHPQLVNIYQADLDVSPPYFVMEFLRGSPLSKVIPQSGPLKPKAVKTLLCRLADALRYLHDGRILHRDITPDNVFLEPDGNIRLVDFGLVRPVDWTPLTAEGAVLGTLRFTPPEVLRGEDFTAAGDVFQAGLVVYYAATGLHPFEREGQSGKQLIRSLASGVCNPIVCKKEIFGEFAEILQQCCSIEQTKRPADGKALCSLLEAKKTPFTRSTIPPELDSSTSAEAVNKSLPPPEEGPQSTYGLLAIIILLGVLLGVFIANQTGEEEKDYDVFMLATNSRPGGMVISWQSHQAYRTWVQLEGGVRPLTYAGKNGKEPTKKHEVIIDGLADNQPYAMKIVFPDGSTTLPRRIKTAAFKLELLAARTHREGKDVSLHWKANAEGMAEVFISSKTVGERRLAAKRNKDDSMSVQLAELPIDCHAITIVTRLSGGGERRVEIVEILKERLETLLPKLSVLDNRRLTKGINVSLLQSLSSVAGEIDSLRDGMEKFRNVRSQENARLHKSRQKARKEMERRLKERNLVQQGKQAAALAPLLFSARLLKVNELTKWYEVLQPWVVLKYYLIFHRIDSDLVPFMWLGQYGAAEFSRLKGKLEVFPLIGPGSKREKRVRLNTPNAFLKNDGVQSVTFHVNVENLGRVIGAELLFEVSHTTTAALVIKVNEFQNLYFPPILFEREKLPFVAYQAVPIHMLKEGKNQINITYDGLLGRVTPPVSHIKVTKLSLRLQR